MGEEPHGDNSRTTSRFARSGVPARALRRMGIRDGLPHQTADGVMFFQLDDYTLTVTQILELLDNNRLDREGIRALALAQKK